MIVLPPIQVEDAEVIELANHREGAEPKLRILRGSSCFCTFVFDEHARTVTCARCKKVWDPFDALVYIGRTWQRYAANRDAIKREIEGKQAIVERLRKDLRNLKAQRRRLTPAREETRPKQGAKR